MVSFFTDSPILSSESISAVFSASDPIVVSAVPAGAALLGPVAAVPAAAVGAGEGLFRIGG